MGEVRPNFLSNKLLQSHLQLNPTGCVTPQSVCTKSVDRSLTPRPTPTFYSDKESYSTKKQRNRVLQAKESIPPDPPNVKSHPRVSLFFGSQDQYRPRAVSFTKNDSLTSSVYNNKSNKTFFDQCFEVISRIGHGSFGEVFKVRCIEDGQLYAVKRLRVQFRGETDRKRRLAEVEKHEKLRHHAACVGFVKAWEERNYLYIQTELCKTSLSQLIEKHHTLPEPLIWNYLVDLLTALKHLHDHDLVHMDVKPDNIFIDFNDVCKLGDFGLVLDLAKNDECLDAQEGDARYLAPELMQGKFGKPADVFSLGMTILEVVSDLDLPQGGPLWHNLRAGNLPEEFLTGVSPELVKIIRLMLEPNSTLRPTVDALLKTSLLQEYLSKFSESSPARNISSDDLMDWDTSVSEDDLEHVGKRGFRHQESSEEHSFTTHSHSPSKLNFTTGFTESSVEERRRAASLLRCRLFSTLTADQPTDEDDPELLPNVVQPRNLLTAFDASSDDDM